MYVCLCTVFSRRATKTALECLISYKTEGGGPLSLLFLMAAWHHLQLSQPLQQGIRGVTAILVLLAIVSVPGFQASGEPGAACAGTGGSRRLVLHVNVHSFTQFDLLIASGRLRD